MQRCHIKDSKQKLYPKDGIEVMKRAWENSTENIQDLLTKSALLIVVVVVSCCRL